MGAKYTETELLDNAIHAFQMETGLQVQVRARQAFENERYIDAIVQIDGQEPLELKGQIKAWAQHINTGALINQIRQLGRNGILITDYVNPKLVERLKNDGIQFMDICGNAFIKGPGIHIYVRGNKRGEADAFPTVRQTRLFNTTGLKITYALLRDPNLANAPYREIAEYVDVALGTVGAIMQDLKRGGFLKERNGQRFLRNQEKLLERWVETYPEKLRPKILFGRFLAEDADWWKNIRIMQFDAQWGGEIAAAKYTDYLKPEIATIYAGETAQTHELIRAARMRKLDEWTAMEGMTVNIYKRFWKPRKGEPDRVDPILTYTDLIATGDPRNREVALEIYDKYIVEHFREG